MQETRSPLKKIDWIDLAIILTIGIVLSYGYFFTVSVPNAELRREFHAQIIDGTADDVSLYRVLVPFVTEPLHRFLLRFFGEPRAFNYTFVLFDSLAICFSLLALYRWLREWFSREPALMGILVVASTAQIALRDHVYQPASLLEPGLFALGFLFILNRRTFWVAVLVVLAALNRPSGQILALAAALGVIRPLALARRKKALTLREVGLSALYIGLGALVYVGLVTTRGAVIPTTVVAEMDPLGYIDAQVIANLVFFLGVFWVFAVLGFKSTPPLIQELLLVVPPYVALMIAAWWFSNIWYEVRPLMTLYPLLIPLALWYLWPGERTGASSGNEL